MEQVKMQINDLHRNMYIVVNECLSMHFARISFMRKAAMQIYVKTLRLLRVQGQNRIDFRFIFSQSSVSKYKGLVISHKLFQIQYREIQNLPCFTEQQVRK